MSRLRSIVPLEIPFALIREARIPDAPPLHRFCWSLARLRRDLDWDPEWDHILEFLGYIPGTAFVAQQFSDITHLPRILETDLPLGPHVISNWYNVGLLELEDLGEFEALMMVLRYFTRIDSMEVLRAGISCIDLKGKFLLEIPEELLLEFFEMRLPWDADWFEMTHQELEPLTPLLDIWCQGEDSRSFYQTTLWMGKTELSDEEWEIVVNSTCEYTESGIYDQVYHYYALDPFKYLSTLIELHGESSHWLIERLAYGDTNLQMPPRAHSQESLMAYIAGTEATNVGLVSHLIKVASGEEGLHPVWYMLAALLAPG